MRRLWRNLCLAVGLMAATPAPAQVLDFEALEGWRDDDHAAALPPSATCDLIEAPDWRPICTLAADVLKTAPLPRVLRTLLQARRHWRSTAPLPAISIRTERLARPHPALSADLPQTAWVTDG
jgi:hypothetical protein